MNPEAEEIFVPKAVAEQNKAVEDFYRQKTEQKPDSALDPQDPESATPKSEETKPDNPPKEPETEEETLAEAPEQEQPEKGKDEPEKPKDSFEQRYKTLKGKYDAEVPRLHGQVRSLTEQNRKLEQKVSDMEAKLKSAPAEDPLDTDYNPDDFEDYGPEMVKLAKANQQLQKQIKDLQDQFSNVTTEVADTKKQAGQNDFMATLAKQVEDWDEQNNDPEFIGWLQNTEPLSGYAYGDLLGWAQSQSDGNRAAQIFLKFREETGKKYAPETATEPGQPKDKQKIPQPTVAPPKSRTGGAPDPSAQGKVFTRDEISAFYKDLSMGKISEEDAKKREHEIFKAKREGRIR